MLEGLSRLLERFDSLRTAAENLPSPNPEDDLLTRLAIVGFSQAERTERWSRAHQQLLVQYHEQELTPEVLAFHGPAATVWSQFACLAFGLLLGAYSAGRIAELEYYRGVATLPGFMFQHAPALYAFADQASPGAPSGAS
jgi:hypothetical protein